MAVFLLKRQKQLRLLAYIFQGLGPSGPSRIRINCWHYESFQAFR